MNRSKRPRSTRRLRKRTRSLALSLGIALLGTSAACHNDAEPTTVSDPGIKETSATLDGHYHGGVRIGDEEFEMEALLTIDGQVRMSIVPFYDLAASESSMQFIGVYNADGDEALGKGVIIGQDCSSAEPSRFCAQTAYAELELATKTYGSRWRLLAGTLRVWTEAGVEAWDLDTGWHDWNYLSGSAGIPDWLSGQYTLYAEFVTGADTIMSIDTSGRVFLQSPASGCIANGQFARHVDEQFNVFDVTLLVENCTGVYAYLNDEYSGLATNYFFDPWDYWGGPVVVWLSTPDSAVRPAAVTLRAVPTDAQ